MKSSTSGRLFAELAAAWAILDLLFNVAIGVAEPLRLVGNLATVGAGIIVYSLPDNKACSVVCTAAAGVVVVFTLLWSWQLGQFPIYAAVFSVVAIVLLLVAAWRFNTASTHTPTTRRR